MKKQLQDLRIKALKEAEDIRLKYQGKPEDMPGDEEERWEKALNDADKYEKQIELLEREEKHKAWGDQLADPEEAAPLLKGLAKGDSDKEHAEERREFEGFSKKAGELFSKLDHKNESIQAALKLLKVGDMRLKEVERRALSVGSEPDGGFWVLPQQISGMIIDLVRDRLWIRQLATVLPPLTSANTLGAMALDVEAEDIDWTSEIGTGNEEDTVKFGKREMEPHPLAKRLKASKKLVRMAPEAVTFVLDRMAYKLARTQEYAYLFGTGNNQPLGVCVESTQGVSTSRNKATASANTVVADDFWDTRATLHESYRERAVWLIHPNMETRIRKAKDSANNYIWQPGIYAGQFLVGGMPQTICGHPYRTSYLMTDPSTSGNITTGTFAAVLADWKELYWIVDMLSMEIQVLTELYAETHQNGYILRYEGDAMPVRQEACSRMKVA